MDPGCPDEEMMLGFAERVIDGPVRETIAAHIEACDECRGLLALMGAAARDRPRTGRYELLSMLGAGGMGIVQAAIDKELDRKVALKFLVTVAHGDQERARARLVREAKALARLAHPNVVTVYDVGVLDGDVYVAMELVVGANLRAWLASAPRTLRAKLDVLRHAGEGLAAAHAAGIVHRDFKPENVLVGEDGRPRVTDFGLARSVEARDEPLDPEVPAARPPPVTRTGIRAGTPAYMAPEQKADGVADARSDIYSYCVTVYEAVTGSRPAERRSGGRPPPAWLDRILARGLRERPEDRWPSMRALLDAMARGPVVTPARAALVVAAAALLAVGVVRGGRSSALSTPRRAVVTETPTRDPRCLGDVTLDFAALKPYWLDASGACGTVASVDGSLVLGQRGACGGARQSTVRLDSAHWAICGDFDVRVTFDLTTFPLPTVGSRYAVLHVVDPASPISGMAIERYAAGDGTTIPGESYKSWASDSNDGIATFVPSTDHAGSFRVTRVGAVVTSYYRVTEDGGAESWRRVLSETASSTPWIVELYSGYGERRGDPAAQAVTFSRLEVLSGSVR